MSVSVFISPERLSTYQKFTDSEARAIALHNHTLQLGSSLMSMIALFELGLRNGVNERIIEDFGSEDWLLKCPASLKLCPSEHRLIKQAKKHAQKAAYSKLTHWEKKCFGAFAYPLGIPRSENHETVSRKRQDFFVVSHGQVISQTTIYFWKRLFAAEYEANLWRRSLKKLFPNKNLKRSDISSSLETVYATRNRVAHHEPVYGDRLHDAIRAIDFLRENIGSKRPEDETPFKNFCRVQNLRLKMDYEAYKEAWATLAK